jgi:chemotaxis protein MotB
VAEADPALAAPAAAAVKPLAPIIVRKVTIVEGRHHGGAWKVAYADFVTAMMAFFLLLWLLGATEEKQRKGIADYFTPTLVKLRKDSAGSDGLLKGSSITDTDPYPNARNLSGVRTLSASGLREAGTANEKSRDKIVALRDKIDRKLSEKRLLRDLARQVRVMRAPEGIRIDLMDDADFAMFELGTTILTRKGRGLIAIIGEILREERAPLILRGHTDSLPWRKGVVANNWSLSVGRAEAMRQALMLSGVAQSRIARIEGVADSEPVIADNPADPRNRRISLLLLDSNGMLQTERTEPAPPKNPTEGKQKARASR